MAETKAEVSLEEYLNNLFSAKGVMVPLTLEEWTGGWVTIVGGINGKPTAQQFNKVFYVPVSYTHLTLPTKLEV